MANRDAAFGTDTLRVTAVEGTIDIANNRSQVTVSLILIGNGTWYDFHDGSASIKLNGSTINSASGTATDLPNAQAFSTKTIIGNTTVWVNHDANGQASVSFSGHLNWPQWPLNVDTGDGSLTLSDIIRPPLAPTGVSASRVNDSQATVSWTNDATPFHGAFGMDIFRSVDDGGYAQIATVTPATTSFSDTGVSANHKYTYKIHPFNTAGDALSAASNAVWTTPGAPTACAATKQPNNDVLVSWSNHVNFGEYTTRIEESQNGGAFTEIASVAGGVTSYTHTTPNTAVTHTYRVRARTTTGTTLNSSYSPNSNTVTLLATANPPTGLSPSGMARDATGAIVLSWTHNPADGTPQSKYQLQHSDNGGSTWTTAGPTTSGTSSYTLPAGTYSNGATVTWRVATAGQNGTLSGYSANASFSLSATPTATLSAPGGTYNSSHLTTAWTYFQAQGSAQAGFLAQLYDVANNLIEQVTGTTAASATFATALADGATYTVKVTVTSAAGLTSNVAAQTFTVAFLPPAGVTVVAGYDSPSGQMVLTVTGDNPQPGVTEPIDHFDIQRSIDDGPWVTMAVGIVPGIVDGAATAVVLDTTPTIRGKNTYRAVAFSALPSSVMSAEVTVTTAEKAWAFLNVGPGFGDYCRARSDLSLTPFAGRARALHHFAGRDLPVQLSGTAVDKGLTVSATLYSTPPERKASTVAEFEAAAVTPGVACWRDPTGRRIFVSVSPIRYEQSTKLPVDEDGNVAATISFDLVQVDYSEAQA